MSKMTADELFASMTRPSIGLMGAALGLVIGIDMASGPDRTVYYRNKSAKTKGPTNKRAKAKTARKANLARARKGGE